MQTRPHSFSSPFQLFFERNPRKVKHYFICGHDFGEISCYGPGRSFCRNCIRGKSFIKMSDNLHFFNVIYLINYRQSLLNLHGFLFLCLFCFLIFKK